MSYSTGIIMKATGGFYYVKTDSETLECRARGIFRKEEITPYVGDRVEVEPTDETKGYLHSIAPRKNFLIRPAVANLDQLVLVVSTVEPSPNLLVLDKLLAIAEFKRIRPVLAISKRDLGDSGALEGIYRQAGYDVFPLSSQTGDGIDALRGSLAGKLTAFTGNTGVGKSSLLNALDPHLGLETAHISKKLGRGRHTTRHVELHEVAGGLVADTPGFSSVELERFEVIFKEELQHCFPEFEDLIPKCRFTGCSHTKERGCAVLQALREGRIAPSRHESYLALYEDAKKLNEWEHPNRN